MFQVHIHDVGGGVGVNHNAFRRSPSIHLHARKGIPAGKLHPGRIAKDSLGIDHVNQPIVEVGGNENQESRKQGEAYLARHLRRCPDHGRCRQRDTGEKNRIRPANPIQQRHHREARQRAAAEIGAIKPGNAPRLARENHRKLHSGQEERQCRHHVQRGQMEEIPSRDRECHGDVQNNLQHDEHQN